MYKPEFGKIGLIAGSGNLPLEIAQYCEANNIPVFVSLINGISDCDFSNFENETCGLGDIGKRIKSLKTAGVKTLTFAGYIKRPDFSSLKLDSKGMLLLPKILTAANKGDDAIMRVVLNAFEKEGLQIIGPEEIHSPMLAPIGALGKVTPNEGQIKDIELAAKVAAEIGKLDIGQGCIVCDGLVLAVEAQEGTDEMLKRVAQLPVNIRGTTQNPKGVLCKRPKPIQEMRIDLPTIGETTLENVIAAGLAGIAIEAEGTLIAQKEKIIELADAAGIFIYGFDGKK